MFSEVEKVRHMPEVRLSKGFVCISWELLHGFDFELMNETCDDVSQTDGDVCWVGDCPAC